MEYLIEQFAKWALHEKRWPLLFLLTIPPAFYFIKAFFYLAFRETLSHWTLILFISIISLASGLLYFFIVSPHQLGRLLISIPICFLGLATAVGGLLRRKPPSLPPDQLVVALAPFSPIGEDAAQDTKSFPHRIESHLREKQEEGTPLVLKQLSLPVTGNTEIERKNAALVLGRSREGQAHIVVWGDVRRDEGELYIHPRLTIAKPLGAEHLEERKIGPAISTGPDYLDFKETLAGEVADLITLILGLAYLRAKNWDQAMEVLTPLHTSARHFYLGLVFHSRAQRSTAPQADLREAITAYLAALEVSTRDDLPQDRAGTQNNLGVALMDQGERTEGEEGNRLLSQAVSAYRAALEVSTRDDLPQNWAMTQNNLGNAFTYQGKRTEGEESNHLLSQAVAAYRTALEVRTRNDLPQGWALTQSNLGNALRVQGQRTEGDAGNRLLSQAVAAYRAALEVRTRVDQPQDWAMTQNNLGNALSNQGEQTEGEEGNRLLCQAVAAYHSALEVRTRDDRPQGWAMTQINLGNTLKNLGERTVGEEGNHLLSEAVSAYRAALEVFTQEYLPYLWNIAKQNLAIALEALEQREKEE